MSAALDVDGFVVVPLLDDERLETARRLFADLRPGRGRGFDIAFASFSAKHRRTVCSQIEPFLLDALNGHVDDVVGFLSTYVVKWPGAESELDFHQDWSYVDEDTDGALIVWVPLVDTGPELDTGALRVVAGSHRFLAPLRGANSVPWYENYREPLDAAARTLMVPAGHAALLDARLIHASAANRSTVPRPALTIRLAPAGRPLRYAHAERSGGWRVYAVDPHFFSDYGPVQLRCRMPAGYEVAEEFPDRRVDIDLAGLSALCGVEVLEQSMACDTDVLGRSASHDDPANDGQTGVLRAGRIRSVRRRVDSGRVESVRLAPGHNGPIPGEVAGAAVVSVEAATGMAGWRVGDTCEPIVSGSWCTFAATSDHEVWNWTDRDVVLAVWRTPEEARRSLTGRFASRP